MAFIQIRKKFENVWEHVSDTGKFLISKFYFKLDDNGFQIVERGGVKRHIYQLSEITVYDDTSTGVPETFTNQVTLYNRLLDLKYTGFDASLIFPPTPITDLTDYKVDFTFESSQSFSIPTNVVVVSVHLNIALLTTSQYSRLGTVLTIIPTLEVGDIINVRGITL